MEYSIQLTKEDGQIVPLSLVAHELAKCFATRWGELAFHRPTYEEVLKQKTINLIHAAQDGDLIVCDVHGRGIRQITNKMVTAKVTQRDWPALRKAHPECEITSDCWNFSGVDLGPAKVTNEPAVNKLFAKLQDLNAWAEGRGDRFSIEEMPVQVIHFDLNQYDENGEVLRVVEKDYFRACIGHRHIDQELAQVQPSTVGDSKQKVGNSTANDWIECVRAIAIEYIKKHKAMDLFPSQSDVCEHIETVARDRKIYGSHGKPIGKSYIQRNAIQGLWWRQNKP